MDKILAYGKLAVYLSLAGLFATLAFNVAPLANKADKAIGDVSIAAQASATAANNASELVYNLNATATNLNSASAAINARLTDKNPSRNLLDLTQKDIVDFKNVEDHLDEEIYMAKAGEQQQITTLANWDTQISATLGHTSDAVQGLVPLEKNLADTTASFNAQLNSPTLADTEVNIQKTSANFAAISTDSAYWVHSVVHPKWPAKVGHAIIQIANTAAHWVVPVP